ncbi:unnamed protein product, partial [Ixodes hexagonus]
PDAEAKKPKSAAPGAERKEPVGQVFSLGTGDVGQLGLGLDVLERNRPTPVPGHTHVVRVVAGGMHSLFLTKTGTVYSFGCNDEGALGRRTSSLSTEMTPGVVELPEPATAICAGDSHSAALTRSGSAFVWGNFRDSRGPMGLVAADRSESKPVRIAKDIVEIVSGSDHLALLTEDGRLLTVGNAEQGQLGRVAPNFVRRGGRRGLSYLLQPKPVTLKRPQGCRSAAFDKVWAGSYVTFARLRATGTLYGFGLNNFHQLGELTSTYADRPVQFVPVPLASCSGRRWRKLCGGQHHTLLLDDAGHVYAMGRSDYGRLGLGARCNDQATPCRVPGLPRCVQVACGDSVSFAATDGGQAYSWGLGNSGQLGHGDEDDVHEPKVMTGWISTKKVLSVSGGGQHSLILAMDS